MTDLGSRSDLEALQRSGRGKIVLLFVLLAAALGAAGWAFFWKPHGIGNAEDRSRILVVRRESSAGYGVALRDVGFDSAEATLSSWETKAGDELADVLEGKEIHGVPAVLLLADKYGYGYVAFERPQELDFTAVELAGGVPTFADHVRFAVVSVGDFAGPHRLTVNPPPSQVMRDPLLVLLQALFEQDRLAELTDGDGKTIEDIQLRDRLRDALEKLARIPEAEKLAEQIERQIEDGLREGERAEPAPSMIGTALESGTPLPLPSGALLSVSRGFELVSKNAIRAELDLADEEQFLFGAPTADPSARTPCTSLAGGQIPARESPRFSFAPDGAAILVKTLSRGYTLWTAAAEPAGACTFTERGTVVAPPEGVEGFGVPHRSGHVARTGQLDGYAVVDVATAGTDERQVLGMIDGDVSFKDLAWWDDDVLVVVGDTPWNQPDTLFFFRLSDPLSVLALSSTLFGTVHLHKAVVVPGATPSLVVVTGSEDLLHRIDLPASPAALFEDPPLADGVKPIERPGLPTVRPLDSNRFVVTALAHEGGVHDVAVSPDGRHVVFDIRSAALDEEKANGDSEIAIVPTQGGPLRLLTRNALRDYDPRFTHDGRTVVFQTRFEVPRTAWVVTATRRVSIE